MDKKRLVLALMTAVIVTLPLALFLGCEIDSAESVITDVDIIVEGYYTNPKGGNLVQENTGNPITSLNVLQDGSSLEAIDNNGLIFRGSIGQVTEGSTASFTLEGYTSTRAAATIVGNFSVSGSESTMRGTWAEPTLYSTVFGTATVPTNAPPETNTTDEVELVASTTTLTIGDAVALTASGAESFDWSYTGTAQGAFSDGDDTDGDNYWTATSTGTVSQIATDHDDSNDSDSVSITVSP